MTYVAIALYLLAGFVFYKLLVKLFLVKLSREFLSKFENDRFNKAIISMVCLFFTLLWPGYAAYGLGGNVYFKLRRLISKKK